MKDPMAELDTVRMCDVQYTGSEPAELKPEVTHQIAVLLYLHSMATPKSCAPSASDS